MTGNRRLYSIVCIALICGVPHLRAGGNGNDFYIKPAMFDHPPRIDGKLENPLWEKGAVLDGFTQYEPQEGAEPSEKTIAYLGYDTENLYIAVRAFDSKPKSIRACLTQRDKSSGDDEVTIYLDSFNDKKRAFVFQVNPCGIQTDGIYTEERRRGRGRGWQEFDTSWDTYFLSDARIDEKGYTVEMAIPFKSLRFPAKNPQVWGLQIKRGIKRKNEEIYWHPRSRDINGFLVQFGTVEIDGNIKKGKNFEIIPVATGLMERGEKFNPQAGLNVKYGITSNLTADAAFNPDFSQVEADIPQNDVNQRYALYFPEKRPFFLEGKDFFDTPLELAYTRKIVDPLWGIKLSGKIGKTTLGLLSTYDERTPLFGVFEEEEEETEEEEDEEEESGRGWVNIFRVKQDLYSESHIGLILTGKDLGDSWNTISQNRNRLAGIDGHFKIRNQYRFSFQVIGSQTKVLDQKTKFVPAARFDLSRRSRHLQLSAEYTTIHPDFEAGTGFIRRKDIHSFRTRISYAFLPQTDLVVDIRPSFEYRRVYDYTDTLTDEEFQLSTFIGGWRGSHIMIRLQSEMERYEGIDFKKNSFRGFFSSEPFSWLSGHISYSFGDSIYYEDNPYLGWKKTLEGTLTLKPLNNLRLFYHFRNENFFKRRGGETEYKVNIISQRINYQISRPLSIRLITDYNDYYKRIYASLLLSYQYRPGTVFYLGIDDNQEHDDRGIYKITGRYVFIKFSYWWRI